MENLYVDETRVTASARIYFSALEQAKSLHQLLEALNASSNPFVVERLTEGVTALAKSLYHTLQALEDYDEVHDAVWKRNSQIDGELADLEAGLTLVSEVFRTTLVLKIDLDELEKIITLIKEVFQEFKDLYKEWKAEEIDS